MVVSLALSTDWPIGVPCFLALWSRHHRAGDWWVSTVSGRWPTPDSPGPRSEESGYLGSLGLFTPVAVNVWPPSTLPPPTYARLTWSCYRPFLGKWVGLQTCLLSLSEVNKQG